MTRTCLDKTKIIIAGIKVCSFRIRSATEKVCSAEKTHHHLSICDQMLNEANQAKPFVAAAPGTGAGRLLGVAVAAEGPLEDLSSGNKK